MKRSCLWCSWTNLQIITLNEQKKREKKHSRCFSIRLFIYWFNFQLLPDTLFCHQCNRENGMKLNAKKHVKTVNIDFSCEYERLLLAWKSFILSFSVRIMYKACAEQKTHLSSTRKAFSTHSIVKQFGWKMYSVHIMNRQIYHSMLYASRSFTF